MGSKGGSLSCCTKLFLFIFAVINLIVFAFGVAAIGVGSYLVVETNKYGFITDNEISGPAIVIASGVLTCLITAFGFLGACIRNKFILAIYGVVLLILIILQIVAGILGAVYTTQNKDTIEEKYSDKLLDGIKEYSTDSSARRAIDNIQKEGKCCGVTDPSDWSENGDFIEENEGELPESCQCTSDDDDICNSMVTFDYTYNNMTETGVYNSTNRIFTKGCYNETVSLIEAIAVVYTGVGLGFGLFEVVVMIIAFGLAFCIHRSSQEYEVV